MSKLKDSGKILLFAHGVSPEAAGTPIIIANLTKQFNPDEMIVAGKCLPEMIKGNYKLGEHRVRPVGKHMNVHWRLASHWRMMQVPGMVSRLTKIIREENCSALLAVYPYEEYLFAAYLAACRTGIRFFPYFHNTYLDNRKGLALTFARWLQPRLFAKAEHVFVMSEGMREFLVQKYPLIERKCSPLLHTFNEPIPVFSELPDPGSKIRFLMTGTISSSNRDAAIRMFSAIRAVPDCELTIFSRTSRSCLEKFGILEGNVKLREVSRAEMLNQFSQFDVFLLPHVFEGVVAAERQTIFPTKVIEYLIGGKPILAHAPADSFIARFLLKHDCALVVDSPDIHLIHQAIEKLRSDQELRNRLVRNALKTAEMFKGETVGLHLRAVINGDRFRNDD